MEDKDEVVELIHKLHKQLETRRGDLRTYISREDVKDAAAPLSDQSITRPKTRQSTVNSHGRVIKVKYTSYTNTLSDIEKNVKKLKGLDADLYKIEKEKLSNEDQTSLEFNMRVEEMLTMLDVNSNALEEMSKQDPMGGMTAFSDHSLSVKEREHKIKMEQADNDRKEREQDRLDKELQWKMSNGPSQPQMHGIKYNKTELPTFSGEDPLQWGPFKDAFMANVHNDKTMFPHAKLTQLRSLLRGIPLALIQNYPCTDANYPVALNLLLDKYGDPDVCSRRYRKVIADLQPATMVPSSLEHNQVMIEGALQALEGMGEDVNTDRNLRLLIFEKFPQEIYDQVEQRAEIFEDGDVHDLGFIRESLKTIVHRKMRSEEFGAKQVHELVPGISTMFAGARNQSQFGTSQQRDVGSGQGPFQPSSRQPGGIRRKQCSYCDRLHYSDSCEMYPSIDSRLEVLRDGVRCTLCLQRNHDPGTCPNKRVCYYCSEFALHHRSLCPKMFHRQNGNPVPTGPATQQAPQHTPQQAPQVANQVPQATQIHTLNVEEIENSLDVNDTASSCFSERAETTETVPDSVPVMHEDGTLLQIANADIRSTSPGAPPNFRPVGSMLDSGGKKSCLLEQTAEKLSIFPYKYQLLELLPFGTNKGNIINCGIAKIELKFKSGEIFHMDVVLVPFICKAIRVVGVNEKVKEICKKMPMAHEVDVPLHYKNIDMLIGIDYFWQINMNGKVEVSEGLFLIETQLGWTLSGRVGNKSDTNASIVNARSLSRNVTDHPAQANHKEIRSNVEPTPVPKHHSEKGDINSIKEPDPLQVKSEPATLTATPGNPGLGEDKCSRTKAILGLQEMETEPDSFRDCMIVAFLTLLTLFSLYPFMHFSHTDSGEHTSMSRGSQKLTPMDQLDVSHDEPVASQSESVRPGSNSGMDNPSEDNTTPHIPAKDNPNVDIGVTKDNPNVDIGSPPSPLQPELSDSRTTRNAAMESKRRITLQYAQDLV